MPLTILVADDDLGTRLSISDYLEISGYSVLTAADGQEALDMVVAYHPHLMVTDIVMPRLNGYELVRRVRQHPTFRLLPVIFLTTRNKTDERIQGYQSGADLYLPKPFELKELGAAIRNLLDRWQMIQTQYRSSYEDDFKTAAQHLDIDPENPKFLLKGQPEPPPDATSGKLKLTQREQEVLEFLTHGLSNGDIGAQLHLSPRTVEKHVSSLLRKTDSSNRAELVRFALENRLVE